MELNILFGKFLKNFITSLIIYYSRKLVYFIDEFFKDIVDVEDMFECANCKSSLRKSILLKLGFDKACPYCDHELNISKERQS